MANPGIAALLNMTTVPTTTFNGYYPLPMPPTALMAAQNALTQQYDQQQHQLQSIVAAYAKQIEFANMNVSSQANI